LGLRQLCAASAVHRAPWERSRNGHDAAESDGPCKHLVKVIPLFLEFCRPCGRLNSAFPATAGGKGSVGPPREAQRGDGGKGQVAGRWVSGVEGNVDIGGRFQGRSATGELLN